MANDSAGIGDPYWYEWSVGLLHVLDMLDDSSGIAGVTLQASDVQGLDDVVVRYHDGSRLCIQVKHTREANTLTFGSLVSPGPENAKGKRKPSLLGALAAAWQHAKIGGGQVRAEVHTNRAVGRRAASIGDNSTKRPALSEFWLHLKTEIIESDLHELTFPTDWESGWGEWLAQLDVLDNSEKLDFLRSLSLSANCPDLEETGTLLTSKLGALFGCSKEQAEDLFAALDHALRQWTSSGRPREEIQQEDVYRALKLHADSVGTTHLVAPPEPFFPSRQALVAELETALDAVDTQVLLLTGSPGAGKTSVISSLASRHDRRVDIRFHAYRPITPDDKRLPADAELDVSADGLWGALLAQLRDLLYGELATYRIPVRNGLLDAGEKRAHVLRIASELGTSRGRPVTIAIDGIDHAVRAKTPLATSFLESLPEPSTIPEHVNVLIGGQQPETWQEYPVWIRQKTKGLRRIDVPALEVTDIEALLQERCPGGLGDVATACQLVLDASSGETLPSIFAVEEARLSDSLSDFRERLKIRSLSAGLQQYYDEIWAAVSKRLNAIRPFLTDRISLVLALWDHRIDGAMLNQAFGDVAIAASDWRTCLLELRPLVIEEEAKFRPMHNDVRLFFSSEYNADPPRFLSHVSALADFSLQHDEESKFSLGFELLERAGRADEFAKHFTPDFVLQGWRSGVSTKRLAWHARQSLLGFKTLRDWDLLLSTICAVATLQQIDECSSWLGYSPIRGAGPSSPLVLPARSSECQVTPKDAWSTAVVERTLEQILEIADSGLEDRARGVLRRWFDGMRPQDLSACLKRVQPEDHYHVYESTMRLYGRALEACQFSPKRTAIAEEDLSSWADMYEGYVEHATSTNSLRRWHRAFTGIQAYSPTWIAQHLRDLVDEDRWMEVALALRNLDKRGADLPASVRLELGVWALLTGDESFLPAWVAPVEDDPFSLTGDISDENQKAEAVVAASFISGFRSRRPTEAVRDDAVKAFRSGHTRGSTLEKVAFFSRVAAVAGRWLTGSEAPPPLSAPELEQVLLRLLNNSSGFDLYSSQKRLATSLFRILVDATRRCGGESQGTVRSTCLSFLRTGRRGPATEALWKTLESFGETDALCEWIGERFKPNGFFWGQGTDSRIEEVALLRELVSRSADFASQQEFLKEIQRETSFGYSGHKEYNLHGPLGWFDSLKSDHPDVWSTEGLALLALSAEADLTGDNRLSLRVESAVGAAATLCGPAALAQLDAAKQEEGANWFEPDSKYWVGGLGEAIEESTPSQTDLMAIWAYGMGCLTWQHHLDLAFLTELHAAVSASAKAEGFDTFASQIESVSGLEWQISSSEPDTKLYGLWYHQDQKRPEQDKFAERLHATELGEAIEEFAHLLSTEPDPHDGTRAAQQLAARLHSERPQDCLEMTRRLLEVCLSSRREPHWPWHLDGIGGILEDLIPLLTDEDHWKLVSNLLDRLEKRSDDEVPGELCQDLDTLCRRRTLDESWLRSGLRLHLETHLKWVSSKRRLPRPILSDGPKKDTWPEFSVAGMLRRLSSDSMLLSFSALRGLSTLAQLVPDSLDEVCRLGGALAWEDKVSLCQLFEYLAFVSPPLPAPVEAMLGECLTSGALELELQSWAVKRTVATSTGAQSTPEFEVEPLDETVKIKLGGPSRLVVESRSKPQASYMAVGTQAAVATLEYLEAAGAPVASIEAALAKSLEQDPPEPACREAMSRPGDAIYQPGGQRARLLEIFRELIAGKPLPTSAGRLAQAILTTDEPRVVFGNWSITSSDWPTDYDLNTLVREGRIALQQSLAEILSLDLAEGQVCIAGVVATFSKNHHVYLHRTPFHRPPSGLIGSRPNATTIGGRALFFGEPNRFENTPDDGNRWLWLRARGLGRFPSQTIGVTPSACLQREGILCPSPTDPLVWQTESGAEVRYERIYGQSRDGLLERAFHIPYLERWVGSDEVTAELEARLGGAVQVIDDLQLFTPEELD